MSNNNDTDNDSPASSDFTFRIVLIGDPAVGKTSLLLRFVDNIFSSEQISTNTPALKTRVVYCGKKSVQLNFVDTCGQELFRTISRSIYHNADAVIVVYDQGNEKSFNNVQFWLREVEHYSNNPKCQKLIAGNKTDLEAKMVVSPETGKNFASSIGLPFFDTSAREDSNVDELFQAVIQAIGTKVHQSEDWNKLKVTRPGNRESTSSTGLGSAGSGRKKASFCSLALHAIVNYFSNDKESGPSKN